ncbi:family 43 glycosylhydrolase [Saccharothrix sp. S26]|uniref:family 43 glycosylhydrolase n=1 Tax=Saccharothrix sp. S26 TaxID=2907215 RepID=UPI001F32EEF5|nr:family 43 glycosylhydrolase [Saccharothrix sp. S26]MCE6998730.1 family 43 glycosylhydrolase [Saccharothrix sp. S26]
MPAYLSPVIGGHHPDASVCRVGEDHYLVCSSFEYFPAVPICHSRDLVRWRQIGNVLARPDQVRLPADVPASRGIRTPTIRHHDGRFHVIATNASAGGTFLVTAERPTGPWSDPVRVDLPGDAPDLAWDDDGGCWCVTPAGQVARINPTTGAVLDGPWQAWPGGRGRGTPRLHRVGDWWYLVSAHRHGLDVARARTPRGPFEPAPADLGGPPIRGADRADLVDTPDGQWWLVLSGARPDAHGTGPETVLARVRQEDGWLVVDGDAGVPPVPESRHPSPPPREDFDEFTLDPCWISPRERRHGSWSLTERPGWLTLRATGDTLDRPGCTFFGRRLRDRDSRVSVRLDPGTARAGLSIRCDEAHHYDLEVVSGRVDVVARIGPVRQVVASRTVHPGPVTLTVVTRTDDLVPPSFVRPTDEPTGVEPTGPDTIAFHVDDDPGPLAELNGRYLSPAFTGGPAGRVVGMYVTRGVAAFDWFDHRDRLTPAG